MESYSKMLCIFALEACAKFLYIQIFTSAPAVDRLSHPKTAQSAELGKRFMISHIFGRSGAYFEDSIPVENLRALPFPSAI